jgi:hypothetical protein
MADAPKQVRLPDQASLATPRTLSSKTVLDALKTILIGTSLTEVLASITRLIEAHSEGMLCSIFLLEKDGLHLRYAVAPNLPESYRKATIVPNDGSCSTAAYRRQAVFVSDFMSDPNCVNFKDQPVSAGLLAGLVKPDHFARRADVGKLRYVFPRSSQSD